MIPSFPCHGSKWLMGDPVEGAKTWDELRLALEKNPSWELHLGEKCFIFNDEEAKNRFLQMALGSLPPGVSGP